MKCKVLIPPIKSVNKTIGVNNPKWGQNATVKAREAKIDDIVKV